MTHEMFEPGSVMEFYPGLVDVRLVQEGGSIFQFPKSLGLVLVCIDRDGWVIKTEMDVLVFCCSGLKPGRWHFNDKHQGSKGPWRLEELAQDT